MELSYMFVMIVGITSVRAAVNVALNKPAYQSSVYETAATADRAVDGDLTQVHDPDNMCFHTKKTSDNWWYVDLQATYDIKSVVLFNRQECCSGRARQIKVLVGDSLASMNEVAFVDQIDSIRTLNMPADTVGRYVKLSQQIAEKEYLHICEVQVFADQNVALNKPAYQSSVYEVSATADRAVDGDLTQVHDPDNMCFHTKKTSNNWWYVDLQMTYPLTQITLYNRQECCAGRARQISLMVGDSLANMNQVAFIRKMGSTKTITLPANTMGRYVRLSQQIWNKEYLHLCEVQVYGGINVALNKPAYQSSVYETAATADRAVDGDLTQAHDPDNMCFHTKKTSNNWWYVDLLASHKIKTVKLFNRQECCAGRARQIKVLVGDTLDNMSEVALVDQLGSTETLNMPANTVGRYVKLSQQITGGEYLHICEVQVFAV